MNAKGKATIIIGLIALAVKFPLVVFGTVLFAFCMWGAWYMLVHDIRSLKE